MITLSSTGDMAPFIRSLNRVLIGYPARLAIPILAGFGLSMLVLPIALASVAITPATGGDNLVVGQFAGLNGPSLAEQTAGDIGVGTITLQVPAGFVFDTTESAVVAAVTDQGDCHGKNRPLRLGTTSPATTEVVTAATSSVTIHVKQRSSGSCRGTITWSGISVEATQLTSGDLTNAGSSVIVGAPAGTSFGHLSTALTPTATATRTPTPTVTSTPTATSTPTMTPTPALTPVFGLYWTARADLPLGRSSLGLVAAGDGKVYAIGGRYSSPTRPYVAANNVDAYEPSTDTWTSLASLLTPRDSLGAAVASNGRIYAIGGRGPYAGAISSLSLVEEYDPSMNTWTRKASMPTARYGLAAVTGPDGRIYAIGGYNENLGYLGTVEVYDPSTDTWSTRTSMPTARAYLGLAASPATNGKIYAVGGEVNGTVLDTVEVYDPVADTWSTAASLPTARSGPGLVYGGDNRVYAIGGLGSAANGYLSLVDAYDPVANTWSSATALSTARAYLGAAVATNGKIYAVGGYDGTSYLAANEEGTITVGTP